MEAFHGLLYGFTVAITPTNLLFCLLGCLIGTLVGVLPGIGPAAAISLLLPMTFRLDITGAIIMLAGIYYGSHIWGLNHCDSREYSRGVLFCGNLFRRVSDG